MQFSDTRTYGPFVRVSKNTPVYTAAFTASAYRPLVSVIRCSGRLAYRIVIAELGFCTTSYVGSPVDNEHTGAVGAQHNEVVKVQRRKTLRLITATVNVIRNLVSDEERCGAEATRDRDREFSAGSLDS